jgi:hypothetical protein
MGPGRVRRAGEGAENSDRFESFLILAAYMSTVLIVLTAG